MTCVRWQFARGAEHCAIATNDVVGLVRPVQSTFGKRIKDTDIHPE